MNRYGMDVESSRVIDPSQKALFEYAKAHSETKGNLEKRLVIRDNKLVFDKISKVESIQAFFGGGPASLKQVAHFCAARNISCKELEDKIAVYNTNHIFLKKILDTDLALIRGNQTTRMNELTSIFEDENKIYAHPREIIQQLEDQGVTQEEFKQLASDREVNSWAHKILTDPRVQKIAPPSAVISLLINHVDLATVLYHQNISSDELNQKGPKKEVIDCAKFLIRHMSLENYAKEDDLKNNFISALCLLNLPIAECFDYRIPLELLFMQFNPMGSEKPVMLIEFSEKKQDIAHAISGYSLEELETPVYKEKSLLNYVKHNLLECQEMLEVLKTLR